MCTIEMRNAKDEMNKSEIYKDNNNSSATNETIINELQNYIENSEESTKRKYAEILLNELLTGESAWALKINVIRKNCEAVTLA